MFFLLFDFQMHSQQLGIILEKQVLFQKTPKLTSFTRVIGNCLNLTYELNFQSFCKRTSFPNINLCQKMFTLKRKKAMTAKL